jgi:spermidine synthase
MDSNKSKSTLSGYLVSLGFISILGQVVLLRELSVAFYGIELIYTLALGIWLFSTACGTMIIKEKSLSSFIPINLLFIFCAIILFLDMFFIRSIRIMFAVIPGAYLQLNTQIAAMSASLIPVGIILGMLFQWTARAYISEGGSLAQAYGVESLGGVAGGIAATLLMKSGLQNFVIALLCVLAAVLSSFLDCKRKQAGWVRLSALVISAALLICLWKAAELDRFTTSWTHPDLIETRDSPYSRITITKLDGQLSVFENDALLFTTEDTHAEEFVHLAALQHPNPKKILILGGGIEGTVREMQKHSPVAIDYVELNPVLLEVVRQHLPSPSIEPLQAANVQIIPDDPRNFLNRSSTYDIILIGMPEPNSGQTNRFYTKEFFQQCRVRLNQHGLIAFSLPSSENLWTPQLTRRMVSIYRSAKAVFPEVLFIPGISNIVIGSTDPLLQQPSLLAARMESRRIKARLISAKYLEYVYTNDRFAEIAKILESGNAPLNTDTRPICYQYTIMIWLSNFIPMAKSWIISTPDVGIIALLASFLIPMVLLSRASWPVRRTFLTGVAGFAGMVLETILLLHFQTKNGVLYQDIGILLTGFMSGLALGSFAMARRGTLHGKQQVQALLSGGILLCAGIYGWFHSGIRIGIPGTLLLLILTGFFVAAVFAYAGCHRTSDQARTIAPLYSADLIGGCFGSLIASLYLAPIAGMAATALLMIPLILCSSLLLLRE